MPISYYLEPSSAFLVRHSDRSSSFSWSETKKTRILNVRKQNDLSKKAKKNLNTATNWISFLSLKRNIKFANGRTFKGFHLSFVTLTLPVKQKHPTSEITKRCLNVFLTRVRERFNVKNYIWKLELQKNGNVHYHLIFDKYIHYLAIRNIWNSAINVLGYVSEYCENFKNMSFNAYCEYRRRQKNIETKKLKKAYEYGKTSMWLSPNTTDVHSVNNVKNITAYISKYLSKGVAENPTEEQKEAQKNLTGRLWYCSQSLSKLGKVKIPLTVENRKFAQLLRSCKKVKEICTDYCDLFYFNLEKLPLLLKRWLNRMYWDHALLCGYPIPS